MEGKDAKCPDGDLLLHINRESVSYAEKMFSHAMIEQHIQEGFLYLPGIEYDILVATVPELKQLLASRKLKVSGKKSDLISRVIENFSIEEIRSTLAPNSYYLLTPKGQEAVENWQKEVREAAQKEDDERRKERIEKMNIYTPLIIAQDYKTALDLWHAPDTISTGHDTYFEAIHLCLSELGILNNKNIMASVDYLILGCYPKTVIEDMAVLGYSITEPDILWMATGCYSYAEILSLRHFGYTRYQIKAMGTSHCERCLSMEGKVFLLNEAKLGETLPPFCESCHCRVHMVPEDSPFKWEK